MSTSNLVTVVEWLRDHPHSSAREAAAGIGLGYRDARYVYGLLESAEHDGWVQRTKTGHGAWTWEAVPLPRGGAR